MLKVTRWKYKDPNTGQEREQEHIFLDEDSRTRIMAGWVTRGAYDIVEEDTTGKYHFRFEALDTAGQEVADTIGASSDEEALQKIKSCGYFVSKLQIYAVKTKKWVDIDENGMVFADEIE